MSIVPLPKPISCNEWNSAPQYNLEVTWPKASTVFTSLVLLLHCGVCAKLYWP